MVFRKRGSVDRVSPEPYWIWDGDRETPTLEGSIGAGPGNQDWHGHMKFGILKACE